MTGRAESQLTDANRTDLVRFGGDHVSGSDGGRMARPSRFTGEEIAQALRQVHEGASAVQVCRKLGVTQTTFYRWRKKFATEVVDEQREVKQLRSENQKLKQIVANLLLEKM
jgi:putative transposase